MKWKILRKLENSMPESNVVSWSRVRRAIHYSGFLSRVKSSSKCEAWTGRVVWSLESMWKPKKTLLWWLKCAPLVLYRFVWLLRVNSDSGLSRLIMFMDSVAIPMIRHVWLVVLRVVRDVWLLLKEVSLESVRIWKI